MLVHLGVIIIMIIHLPRGCRFVGHLLVVQQVDRSMGGLLSPAQTTDGWNHVSGVSEDQAGGENSTVMVWEEEGERLSKKIVHERQFRLHPLHVVTGCDERP